MTNDLLVLKLLGVYNLYFKSHVSSSSHSWECEEQLGGHHSISRKPISRVHATRIRASSRCTHLPALSYVYQWLWHLVLATKRAEMGVSHANAGESKYATFHSTAPRQSTFSNSAFKNRSSPTASHLELLSESCLASLILLSEHHPSADCCRSDETQALSFRLGTCFRIRENASAILC